MSTLSHSTHCKLLRKPNKRLGGGESGGNLVIDYHAIRERIEIFVFTSCCRNRLQLSTELVKTLMCGYQCGVGRQAFPCMNAKFEQQSLPVNLPWSICCFFDRSVRVPNLNVSHHSMPILDR